MDNHPIPEDVTGFKFKLIGNVTIKQFSYLFTAGVICFIFIILRAPFFITLPFILLSASAGFALAFIPIDGRPMDKMILNFIKAIPLEEEYLYRKKGVNLFMSNSVQVQPPVVQTTPVKTTQQENKDKKDLLIKQLKKSHFKDDNDETIFVNSLKPFFEEPVSGKKSQEEDEILVVHHKDNDEEEIKIPKMHLSMPHSNFLPNLGQSFSSLLKQHDDLKDEEEIKKEVHEKKKALINDLMKKEENSDTEEKLDNTKDKERTEEVIKHEIKPIKADEEQAVEEIAEEPVLTEEERKELEKRIEEILKEKELLEKKLLELIQQKPKEKVYEPTSGKNAPNETPNAKKIEVDSSIKSGFPILPDIPNIILGIVKDPRGKVLPNILVEVVDKDSSPVRAFKTNQLGQFKSATPLHNGIYKIVFEDTQKQHEFDTIEIALDGKIFQPIEVRSVDLREKLRRELFEGKN